MESKASAKAFTLVTGRQSSTMKGSVSSCMCRGMEIWDGAAGCATSAVGRRVMSEPFNAIRPYLALLPVLLIRMNTQDTPTNTQDTPTNTQDTPTNSHAHAHVKFTHTYTDEPHISNKHAYTYPDTYAHWPGQTCTRLSLRVANQPSLQDALQNAHRLLRVSIALLPSITLRVAIPLSRNYPK